MRGGEHLPAPTPKEPMQGVRGREHLPAPAHQEHMQGLRGREHLPATAREERLQGVRGGDSARISAGGAIARSAECKPRGGPEDCGGASICQH